MTTKRKAPSLKESQTFLKELLLSGGNIHATEQGAKLVDETTFNRMFAYQNGYVARFEEALQETYPALFAILGHDKFHGCVEKYARTHPSQSYDLSRVGGEFPSFVETQLGTKYLFIRSLADLEWCIHNVFHAKWETSVTQEDLKEIPVDQYEQLVFKFQPAFQVFHSSFDVFRIWKSHKAKKLETPKDCHILIYRQEDEVLAASITKEHAKLLALLVKSKTLGEALSEMIDELESISAELTGWMATWMQLGLLTNVRLKR